MSKLVQKFLDNLEGDEKKITQCVTSIATWEHPDDSMESSFILEFYEKYRKNVEDCAGKIGQSISNTKKHSKLLKKSEASGSRRAAFGDFELGSIAKARNLASMNLPAGAMTRSLRDLPPRLQRTETSPAFPRGHGGEKDAGLRALERAGFPLTGDHPAAGLQEPGAPARPGPASRLKEEMYPPDKKPEVHTGERGGCPPCEPDHCKDGEASLDRGLVAAIGILSEKLERLAQVAEVLSQKFGALIEALKTTQEVVAQTGVQVTEKLQELGDKICSCAKGEKSGNFFRDLLALVADVLTVWMFLGKYVKKLFKRLQKKINKQRSGSKSKTKSKEGRGQGKSGSAGANSGKDGSVRNSPGFFQRMSDKVKELKTSTVKKVEEFKKSASDKMNVAKEWVEKKAVGVKKNVVDGVNTIKKSPAFNASKSVIKKLSQSALANIARVLLTAIVSFAAAAMAGLATISAPVWGAIIGIIVLALAGLAYIFRDKLAKVFENTETGRTILKWFSDKDESKGLVGADGIVSLAPSGMNGKQVEDMRGIYLSSDLSKGTYLTKTGLSAEGNYFAGASSSQHRYGTTNYSITLNAVPGQSIEEVADQVINYIKMERRRDMLDA